MGKNFTIDGLDDLIDSINDMANEFPSELQKLVNKHGGLLLRNVKMKTPVGQYDDGRTGGTLRRGWTSEKGDLYYTVINNCEYAEYVEYGHRTRNRKSYVEGKYMLVITFEKQSTKFIKELEELLKKYGFN